MDIEHRLHIPLLIIMSTGRRGFPGMKWQGYSSISTKDQCFCHPLQVKGGKTKGVDSQEKKKKAQKVNWEKGKLFLFPIIRSLLLKCNAQWLCIIY